MAELNPTAVRVAEDIDLISMPFSTDKAQEEFIHSAAVLIHAALEAERERCAKVADAFVEPHGPGVDTGRIWRSGQAARIAAAIRASAGEEGK